MNESGKPTVIKAGLCTQCKAPLPSYAPGTSVQCEYCKTFNYIPTADKTPSESLGTEIVRLSKLKSQLDHPVSGHAYDLVHSPLSWIRDGRITIGQKAHALKEWEKLSRSNSSTSSKQQRQILWLALKTADLSVTIGDHVQIAQILERALQLLPDAGHTHLICCRMVEAAVDGNDLNAALQWFSRCDATSEVLELDSAYRIAAARLFAAQRKPAEIFKILGKSAGNLPLADFVRKKAEVLRAHAFELNGAEKKAIKLIRNATAKYGLHAVLHDGDTLGLSPKAKTEVAQQFRRERLAKLTADYRGPAFGRVALWGSLNRILFWTGVCLLGCLAPRWFLDMDPLLGMYGIPLCPHVCEDCFGPSRTVTVWHETGDGEASSGAEYFCRSSQNNLATLTDAELEKKISQLERYRLPWPAAWGGSYLLLLLILAPLSLFFAKGRYDKDAESNTRIREEIFRIAHEAGEPIPTLERSVFANPYATTVLFIGGTAVGALGMIVLSLWYI